MRADKSFVRPTRLGYANQPLAFAGAALLNWCTPGGRRSLPQDLPFLSRQGNTRAARFSALLVTLLFLSACRHPGVLPKDYLALVADEGSQAVAVVNMAEFKCVRMLPLGFVPRRLVLRPGGREVYVASESGLVAVIRLPGLRVLSRLECGRGSVAICFSPHGRRAYVLARGSDSLTVINCRTMKVMRRFPLLANVVRIALTRDGHTLLAEDTAGGQLLFVNPQTGRSVASVRLGQQPGPMVVLQFGQKAFVADADDRTVTVVDLSGKQVLSHIELGSPPAFLALKPDGGELFAFSPADSTLTILDTSDDSVEQSLPTGIRPSAAVFRRDSRTAYIANEGDGTVTTLDVNSRTVLASTRVGIQPDSLALTPDDRFLAIADFAGASLAILRTRNSSLLTTIPVGSEPVDVVIPGWEQ